jgi:SAM-dependent methyltransferase
MACRVGLPRNRRRRYHRHQRGDLQRDLPLDAGARRRQQPRRQLLVKDTLAARRRPGPDRRPPPELSVAALRESLRRLLAVERYPRAAAYDPAWVIDNLMGPHALWLTEALAQVLPLRAGMRVLDLGCGKALSSIFLARELDVEVWATDLWIAAEDNLRRIREAGLEGRVHAVHAEAHALPFADGFFDALVSVDAYHYFGTDDLYLGQSARLLTPGGRIGIVVPGFREEPESVPPPHLAPHWQWDMCSFHSPAWWRRHWEKTGLVTVEVADAVPEGFADWGRWLDACARAGRPAPDEAALLAADGGRSLGFTRVVARTPSR